MLALFLYNNNPYIPIPKNMTASLQPSSIKGAQIVVPCGDGLLTPTLDFFMKDLGFKVSTIFPADEPKIAVIFGHGLCLRLVEEAAVGAKSTHELHILCNIESLSPDAPTVLTAPNGMRVVLVEAEPKFEVQEIKVQKVIMNAAYTAADHHDEWVVGRAGMQYKDLIPGRLDGAVIASIIKIPTGGPVPDYAHFHLIRFQIIFCRQGWVKVVYEDQGEPFILYPGDAVLQPPGIRHQVLESSDALEVVEISAPAVHATHADHSIILPTGKHLPDRVYGNGQCFTRHISSQASIDKGSLTGWDVETTGIGKASNGEVGLRILRSQPVEAGERLTLKHGGEMKFFVVLEGAGVLSGQGFSAKVVRDDSFALPADETFELTVEASMTVMEVSVPVM
ncbi:hypothetical protein BC829DRAFT_405315 [Chytridium lagenaria]|nr:hypothetical protein BC829DRAFT_405315 [Chytridium lagenaria]